MCNLLIYTCSCFHNLTTICQASWKSLTCLDVCFVSANISISRLNKWWSKQVTNNVMFWYQYPEPRKHVSYRRGAMWKCVASTVSILSLLIVWKCWREWEAKWIKPVTSQPTKEVHCFRQDVVLVANHFTACDYSSLWLPYRSYWATVKWMMAKTQCTYLRCLVYFAYLNGTKRTQILKTVFKLRDLKFSSHCSGRFRNGTLYLWVNLLSVC
jgi:hypothetical protein